MFWGYLHVILKYSLYVWGLGVFPYVGDLGASASLGVHMLHLVLSCSSLCLCIYHGYDHYSSGYGGVFWAVICFIGDCGPFPDGQHEVILQPPLMPRGSEGVIGLASVPQQQPPSSMPLLTYANYAMGSLQVGFLFRAEPPTILYIICLTSILVSAFYFQVPSWMPYSPMGAQPLGFAPLQPFGIYP